MGTHQHFGRIVGTISITVTLIFAESACDPPTHDENTDGGTDSFSTTSEMDLSTTNNDSTTEGLTNESTEGLTEEPESSHPPPCPIGWVRPTSMTFESPWFSIGDKQLDASFDLNRVYPHSIAHGTCLYYQPGDLKLTGIDIEFGPEVMGYPQSRLQLWFEHGEGEYEMSSTAKQGPDLVASSRTFSYTYTHVSAQPNLPTPLFETWTIQDAVYYSLSAYVNAIPQIPGESLVIKAKTSIQRSDLIELVLGFDITATVEGTIVPSDEVCAKMNSKLKCMMAGCARTFGIETKIDGLDCSSEHQQQFCAYQVEEIDSNSLPPGHHTFYDPKAPDRAYAIYNEPELGKSLEIPAGWIRCASDRENRAGDPVSCECICTGDHCRSERLRDQMEACMLPRPCPVVDTAHVEESEGLNPAQACLLGAMRDKTPGSFRADIATFDVAIDTRIHVLDQNRVLLSSGRCSQGRDRLDQGLYRFKCEKKWNQLQRCTLNSPDYFAECLAGTPDQQRECFHDLTGSPEFSISSGQNWFNSCETLNEALCQ